jgi:hypothetical protein
LRKARKFLSIAMYSPISEVHGISRRLPRHYRESGNPVFLFPK